MMRTASIHDEWGGRIALFDIAFDCRRWQPLPLRGKGRQVRSWRARCRRSKKKEEDFKPCRGPVDPYKYANLKYPPPPAPLEMFLGK